MAELREEVEFPVLCHLVAREFTIRWQHLIFIIIYIVQLYKEDWGILRMLGCRAIALPITKQIVENLLTALGMNPHWIRMWEALGRT